MPDLITTNHDIDSNAGLSLEEKIKAKAQAQADYEEASQRIHNISQLLRAYCVFEKDVHYVVQENKVVIVDEYTGRLMPGKEMERWIASGSGGQRGGADRSGDADIGDDHDSELFPSV